MKKSKILFLVLSAAFLVLVGIAFWQDASARQYITVQEQYQQLYHEEGSFTIGVQQLFPSFSESQSGSEAFPVYKTERCISCHVPDITTISPNQAAQRISQDFFKYEPNAKQLAAEYHLTGVHPAYIDQQYCDTYGSSANATADGFHSYLGNVTSSSNVTAAQEADLSGFVPSFLCDSLTPGEQLSIADVGCIVCHNGNRLALDESDAHQNLIINPEYSWSEGAAIYYEYCISCHGLQGGGNVGPPLSNQDRLGFFNEDYYYRCIEYGFTDFEHIGSVMPAWGSISSDFSYNPSTTNAEPLPATTVLRDINDYLTGIGAAQISDSNSFLAATAPSQQSDQALLNLVSNQDGINFTNADLTTAIGDNHVRTLSEQQIVLMTQFIRHWEDYQTLP